MDINGYDITQLGPWAFVVYIAVKDILPKLFPDLVKVLDKRVSNEERLFRLLEAKAEQDKSLTTTLVGLQRAIEGLGSTLVQLDSRLDKIESVLGDSSTQAFINWYSELPKATRDPNS